MTPQEHSEWQDFVTHPCWGRMTGFIREMLLKETSTLASQCMQEAEHVVRAQAGVVDGVKRVITYLDRQAAIAHSKPDG